jgi:hypothetical protein
MFVAQAKLHFCRARRNAPTVKNSRAVGLLIDADVTIARLTVKGQQ